MVGMHSASEGYMRLEFKYRQEALLGTVRVLTDTGQWYNESCILWI